VPSCHGEEEETWEGRDSFHKGEMLRGAESPARVDKGLLTAVKSAEVSPDQRKRPRDSRGDARGAGGVGTSYIIIPCGEGSADLSPATMFGKRS